MVDGKYTTAWEFDEEMVATPEPYSSLDGGPEEEIEEWQGVDRIHFDVSERHDALQLAIQHMAGSFVPTSDLVKRAEEFLEYIRHGSDRAF